MGSHAILSPSAAHRWLVCTPSARFEEQIPEEESAFVAEGTLAHDLAALLLSARVGTAPKGFTARIDEIQKNPMYSAEMLDHCEAYVNFVMDKGGRVLVEQRFDLSQIVPLSWGTADAVNAVKNVLHVTDFKYGAGVRVNAKDNAQLMLYGAAAYLKLLTKKEEFSSVVLSIFQPRAGGVSTWEISIHDLKQWAENEVRPKAKLAIAGRGEFKAGKHCHFCKARTVCKAYYNRFAEMRNIQDKRVMTDEDTATVLTYGDLVSKWVSKVIEDSTARLQRGERIKGFKLVAGRGRRSFKNEDDVIDVLLGEGYESDKIFDSKLQSLTALEKMVGAKRFKELFADHILSVEGKPQLAPEDDSRQAICKSAADEFNDENDLL